MFNSVPLAYELCQINEVAKPGVIGENWFQADSDSDSDEDELYDRSSNLQLSFTVNIIEDRRILESKNVEDKKQFIENRPKASFGGGALNKKTFGSLNTFGSKKFSLLAQFVKKLSENNQEPVQAFKKQQLKFVKICCLQNEIDYNYLSDMAQVKLMEVTYESQMHQHSGAIPASTSLLARRLPRPAPAAEVKPVESTRILPEQNAAVAVTVTQIAVQEPPSNLQNLAQILTNSQPNRQLPGLSMATGPVPASTGLGGFNRWRGGLQRDKTGPVGFDTEKKFRTLDEIPKKLVEEDIPLILEMYQITETLNHEIPFEKAISYLESIKSKIREAKKNVLEFEG